MSASALTGVSRSAYAGHNQSRVGFALGGSLGYRLRPGLSAHVGALFAQRGWTNNELHLHVDYLDLPILLRAELSPPSSGLRAVGLLGLVTSFELSCGGMIDQFGGPGLPPTNLVVPIDCDTIRSVRRDTGLLVGLGVRRPYGPDGRFLRAEVRYTHGLTDLQDPDGVRQRKNRYLALLVGLEVPLSR